MKKLSLIILALLMGCSSKPKQQNVVIENQCKVYTESLQKVVGPNTDSHKQHEFSFIQDEAQALVAMDSLNLKMSTIKNDIRNLKDILSNCTEERMQAYKNRVDHNACYPEFSEYVFLKALAWGTKDYNWAKTTKDKAKAVINNYLLSVAEGETSLLQMNMAIDLALLITEMGYAPKRNAAELKKYSQEMAAFTKKMGEEFKQKGSYKMSCPSMNPMNDEFAYSNEMAAKLKKLLTKNN